MAETTTTAHVLVVEDDALIALDIEQMLVELGPVRVTLAHDLAMGLDALEAHCPDLAILDIDLGASNSLPIAARLASLGKPYLFLTGHQASGARHLGCDVLEKPVSSEALAQIVRRLLRRR